MSVEAKVNVEVNAADILKVYWPVMTLPLLILFVLGAGCFTMTVIIGVKIHQIIVMYTTFIAGLVLYGASVFWFFNAALKEIRNEQ